MLHGFITDINFWLVLESTKSKYHSYGANTKKFGISWHNALIYIISCAFLGRISLLWHQGRHPSAKKYIPWPLMHPSATIICARNWLILAHFTLIKYTIWCCFTLYVLHVRFENRDYLLFLYDSIYQCCMDLSQISTSDWYWRVLRGNTS